MDNNRRLFQVLCLAVYLPTFRTLPKVFVEIDSDEDQ